MMMMMMIMITIIMSDIDDKEDKEKENTAETRVFHIVIFLYIPIPHLSQYHSRLHNQTPIPIGGWLMAVLIWMFPPRVR
jgi:hypothetical protein